jgi:hypothetical protein
VVAAEHRVEHIVLFHFNLMCRVVAHKDAVRVRWGLIFLVYVLVVLTAPFVRRQKRYRCFFISWVILGLDLASSHNLVKLVQLLKTLWRCMDLANKLTESGVKSIVHVSENDSEVGEDIAVKMAAMRLAAFGFLYEVTHHRVALLNCILTVAQMTCDEIEVVVLEDKIELNASFVADHAK